MITPPKCEDCKFQTALNKCARTGGNCLWERATQIKRQVALGAIGYTDNPNQESTNCGYHGKFFERKEPKRDIRTGNEGHA